MRKFERPGILSMIRKVNTLVGLTAVITVFLFFLASCSPNEGFNTPEDVVITYLEGLRDSDFDRMLETLPIDISLGLMLVDNFITQLNNLLERFELPIEPYEFQSLEIIGFIPPEAVSEQYLSEANQEILLRLAELLGVEQLVSRIIIFELGGEKFAMIVDVADFGGSWYLADFGGSFGRLLNENISELEIPLEHRDVAMDIFRQGIIPPEFVNKFLEGFDLEGSTNLFFGS